MLSILDRYLLKELIGPFLFGIAAFTFILSGSTVLFALIGEAVRNNIPMTIIMQLFLYKLPYMIVLSFPMSTLLATIIAFGRLSADSEILAFRAGGIAFGRLVTPIFITGFLISLTTIFFNESIVPRASHSGELLYQSFMGQQQPTIKKNVNFTEYKDGAPYRIINVAEIDNGLLKKISVAEYEQGQLARLIRSNSGRWLPTGGWEFYNGVMHSFPIDTPDRVTFLSFKKEYIDIPINPLSVNQRNKNVEEMTSRELKEKIAEKRSLGQDILTDSMNYHMKFSVPFASLIFSILGASVGLKPHRSSSAMGLGISLIVIFIYYILLSLGMGLGLAGTVPPVVGAWLPNIIVGIFGLYLLKRLSYR